MPLPRNKIGKMLVGITVGKYYDRIPLQAFSDSLKVFGLEMESDFILCGHEGRTVLGLKGTDKAVGLALSWYRMPSGRYEVNAYLT